MLVRKNYTILLQDCREEIVRTQALKRGQRPVLVQIVLGSSNMSGRALEVSLVLPDCTLPW